MSSKITICLLVPSQFTIKKEYFQTGFPPEIYEILIAIQASFFLSHQIRINTNVSLMFLDENLVIEYIGTELQFLGPDERSIGMLLMKALEKKDKAHNNVRIRSTPGIWIQRRKTEDILNEFRDSSQIILADNDSDADLEEVPQKDLTLFIPVIQNGASSIESFFSDQPVLKFKIKDLPKTQRAFLTILRFYSFIDNI